MNADVYLLVFVFVVIFSVITAIIGTRKVIRAEYNKKVQIDISVEEMIERERKITEFLKENNLKPDGSIAKIADVLRVKSGGFSDKVKGRAELSEPDVNGNMTVTHSIKVPTQERLFDFAHECGHLVNGDPTPANRPAGYNKPKMEQLADYTAAALLMPWKEVLTYLVDSNYETASNRKRVEIVRKLSKRYKVNEIIAIRRIKEVRLLSKTNM